MRTYLIREEGWSVLGAPALLHVSNLHTGL